MVDSGTELEDVIDVEEKFRVLGFCLRKMNFSHRFSMKIESVGLEVRSVYFNLSVFSKNDCNSEGDKQTQH